MFKHQINNQLDLRLLHYRHAEEIYACVVRNRDHLEPWFPWVKLTTDSEAIRKFIESELNRFAKNNGFSAGIFYEDRYIGNISFHDVNWNTRLSSIGYWLASEYEGKGIMTSCCRALIHYGFEVMGLNKIEIRARTDNARSRAIPLRLGFREEGILRSVSYYNDEYYDHVVYGLLRDEWKGERDEAARNMNPIYVP
jgi:ribosomal-protein-serine acetyltransferase